MLKQFLNDKQGIFWVWIIALPMIFVITISWFICAFVLSINLDFLGPMAAAADPQGASIVSGVRTSGAIFIVIVDVLILAWAAVASFKKEREMLL
jgi:uncharacterized membrane protein YidH (DUF202 family)